MKWRDILHRTNLVVGLISLALALWAGMHIQHLVDDAGSRHSGEAIVALALALLVFAASRYGAGLGRGRE